MLDMHTVVMLAKDHLTVTEFSAIDAALCSDGGSGIGKFVQGVVALDNENLDYLADNVILSHATGDQDLFLWSVQEIVSAVRARDVNGPRRNAMVLPGSRA